MQQLKPGDLLHNNYTLRRILGSGAQGTTWLAQDTTGHEVAIKHLALAQADGWKAVELFEREGAVLRRLEHPGIPRYIDALRDESPALRLLLVQEFVPGDTIDQLLARGERWDEARLRAFLLDVLDILIYLGAQRPPIIHRDIKPGNLIIRPDGSLALIDFGGVLADLRAPTGGSTVVGTTGYMPPEQLIGRATCASDLYALGATAVHMHTGADPSSLPVERMRLRYHDRAHLSPALLAFLDRLLEPTPEDRLQTAQQARDALLAPAQAAPAARSAPNTFNIWGEARYILVSLAPLLIFFLLIGGAIIALGRTQRQGSSAPAIPTPITNIPTTLNADQAPVICERTTGTGAISNHADEKKPRTAWYTISCTLFNKSPDKDLLSLSAQLQLFDAQDKLVGGQPWPLLTAENGPLRPGERRTAIAQLYSLEAAPARALITINNVKLSPASPARPPAPVEISYEVPVPDDLKLVFSNMEILPADHSASRYTPRLRLHLQNVGAASLGTLEVRVEPRDAAGVALEQLNAPLSWGAPLPPGPPEVRVARLPKNTASARLVVVKLIRAR